MKIINEFVIFNTSLWRGEVFTALKQMELKDFPKAKEKFVAESRPGMRNKSLPQYYQ